MGFWEKIHYSVELRNLTGPGVVTSAFNTSTLVAEAGGSL